jgi:hypothetical protein
MSRQSPYNILFKRLIPSSSYACRRDYRKVEPNQTSYRIVLAATFHQYVLPNKIAEVTQGYLSLSSYLYGMK